MSFSELIQLGLEDKYLNLLLAGNFRYVHEVTALNASQLSKELHVPLQEAFKIVQIVKNKSGRNNSSKSKNVIVQKNDFDRVSFVTGCKNFDKLLGGSGIVSGSLIEVCGSFGVGKTTFLMQCAATATLPKECGGLQTRILYIDSEGSFSKYKIEKIIQSTRDKFQKEFPNTSFPNSEVLLDRIDYYRATDIYEFLACMTLLEASVKLDHYGLIIIDSITEHFRHTVEGVDRSKILYNIADRLKSLSRRLSCCVLLSNQMRTNIEIAKRGEQVPALGDKWAHAISCRIVMNKFQGGYVAQLYKSVQAEQQRLGYTIDPLSSLICDAPIPSFDNGFDIRTMNLLTSSNFEAEPLEE